MSLSTEFLTTLHLLIRTPSVVGAERHFFSTVRRELESLGIQVKAYEGVLVASGERPEKGILCAHADRHGLISTGPNEFQYAAFTSKFRNLGEIESVSRQMISSIQERFNNQVVHAYNPWSGSYIGQGTIHNSHLCDRRDNLVFEVKGLEGIAPGIPLAFDDKLVQDEGWIRAQLDNVLSVAIIIELYRLGYQGTALFSAEEEAGRSWRFIYDYYKRIDVYPKDLIILDTSPFSTKEDVQNYDIILRNCDASAEFNKELTHTIASLCFSLGYRTLKKDEYVIALNEAREKEGVKPLSLGRTELGRLVSESGGLLNGVTLQVPTTGYHTSEETTTQTAIQAMIKLLTQLVID